jgi:hypothetical protein
MEVTMQENALEDQWQPAPKIPPSEGTLGYRMTVLCHMPFPNRKRVELQHLTSALVGSGHQILVPATLTSSMQLTLLSMLSLHDYRRMNAQGEDQAYLPVHMFQVENCRMDFDATLLH